MNEIEYIKKLQCILIHLFDKNLGRMITRHGELRAAVFMGGSPTYKKIDTPMITCTPLLTLNERNINKFIITISFRTNNSESFHKKLIREVNPIIINKMHHYMTDKFLKEISIDKKNKGIVNYRGVTQYVTPYIAEMSFYKPLFDNFKNPDYWDICKNHLD